MKEGKERMLEQLEKFNPIGILQGRMNWIPGVQGQRTNKGKRADVLQDVPYAGEMLADWSDAAVQRQEQQTKRVNKEKLREGNLYHELDQLRKMNVDDIVERNVESMKKVMNGLILRY